MRARRRPVRVLITPREVAGVSVGLHDGLIHYGFEADMLLRWPHPFSYSAPRPRTRSLRALFRLVEREHGTGRPNGPVARAISLAARVVALPLLALRYDAVVYVGADTLLRHGSDRAFFQRAGCRVITIFCGSDARPPYLNGFWINPTSGEPDFTAIRAATKQTRARVERAERQSDFVVNHPATAQFQRKAYVDWTVMGMPGPDSGPAPWAGPGVDESVDRPVRVLHAPSDPEHKGSTRIRAAVEQLRRGSRDIDYTEVSGESHATVQRLLHDSDVVVDELWSDALLAGLATEAARLGKPVVVCGYAGDLLRALAGRVGAPADHYVHPDDLLDRLTTLVDDAAGRRDLGGRLRTFVEAQWSQEAIAGRYARLITGQPDASWLDGPDDAVYVHGWGVDEHVLRARLRTYIDQFGERALELPPGPQTEAVRSLLADDVGAQSRR